MEDTKTYLKLKTGTGIRGAFLDSDLLMTCSNFWENPGCVILNMSMTTHISLVTHENIISFIHVSCLYSESLLKLQYCSSVILESQLQYQES